MKDRIAVLVMTAVAVACGPGESTSMTQPVAAAATEPAPPDNCPGVDNTDQLDTDKDGKGDACDEDDERWRLRSQLWARCADSARPSVGEAGSTGIRDGRGDSHEP